MIKHPIQSTKRFVRRHQFALTVTATAAGFAAGCRLTANQYQDFLKEIDPKLIDKFFDLSEDVPS